MDLEEWRRALFILLGKMSGWQEKNHLIHDASDLVWTYRYARTTISLMMLAPEDRSV